jgi:hypothetical protein
MHGRKHQRLQHKQVPRAQQMTLVQFRSFNAQKATINDPQWGNCQANGGGTGGSKVRPPKRSALEAIEAVALKLRDAPPSPIATKE